MELDKLYAIALDDTQWTVPQNFDAVFNWEYDEGRKAMMGLYQKGKDFQWDAAKRIDWSQELDEENPEQLPEEMLPISGADFYEKMSRKEKANVRRHFQAWQISQFMQGEQGALICAAKIVMQVPDIDSKFYASTQTIDEARHVEAYKHLLEKFGVAYPMTPPLKELIDQTLRDSRWDMTYLGMQVVIEGLGTGGLPADPRSRAEPSGGGGQCLCDAGRVAACCVRASRPARLLSAADPEGARRARGIPDRGLLSHARSLRRGRGLADSSACRCKRAADHMYQSGFMDMFRSTLFTRIVPIVKDVGLWGEKVREGYAKMGVLGFADTDVDGLQKADDTIARDFDARRKHVDSVIRAAE